MAARCASCSYSLSVSDSVSCCECLSYFHIDCAQLVGFPYYELSSDPIRNIFHCQTCKILPLPRQSDGLSDSDSDEDCIMPSRQLDYHLEGQPDFAKDMNEVKGTVQDLSELCKDMFREISELKSINLTLRCCVENLRHDGEQRDGMIAELKKRIEALEGKASVSFFKPIDKSDVYVDRISIEKEEDAERYLTPDPEYSRLKEIENLEYGSIHSGDIPQSDEVQHLNSIEPNLDDKTLKTGNNTENSSLQKLKSYECAIEIPDTVFGQTSVDVEKGQQRNDEIVHFAEEETMTSENREEKSETGAIALVKDWGWRGNDAIQLKENENESSAEEEEENEEEEEENETTYNEDTEAQGWEILDEDVKSEFVTKQYETEASGNARRTEVTEEENEEKRVTWADEVDEAEDDEEEENLDSNEEAEESNIESYNEYLTENTDPRIEASSTVEGEETEETTEDEAEGTERTSLKDEEGVERSKFEEDIEIVEGGVEVEGRLDAAERSRLEGELRLESDPSVEKGAEPEGDREGGQSPKEQGEVQPSELREGSEPPPPPQLQHTPDDLWDYLKETVTGEHPATVEEFVQKLIGTLEHVPEEYLKPVIDYNIKRATSPSVTDGEHLDSKEGDQHVEGEYHGTEEMNIASEGEDLTTKLPEGEASATEGDGFLSEEPASLHEDPSNFPEDPSESAEGYSALEAAS